MKEFIELKCKFCGAYYKNHNSYKRHVDKCNFNPRTKSCASCAFFKWEEQQYPYEPGIRITYQACLVNMLIGTDTLKKQCPKYLDPKYREDQEIMKLVIAKYDFTGTYNYAMKKCEPAVRKRIQESLSNDSDGDQLPF